MDTPLSVDCYKNIIHDNILFVKWHFPKLVLDKQKRRAYNVPMENKNTLKNDLSLAEMKFKEVVQEWKRQRREFFAALKKSEHLTNEDIAMRYKPLSRQMVGQILAGK